VRRATAQQLVKHRADRVDVGARVDLLAARLLRRHVGRRAEHRALRGRHRIGRFRQSTVERGLLGAHPLREPPVDDDGLAERAEQHVAGLQIAMDNATCVRVGHRFGDGEDPRDERESRFERRRIA
jgi:hypothetical protein